MSLSTPPRRSVGGSPAKRPLGVSRTNSSNTLARQFVDRHSTTYAHLYEHDDATIRREKLEMEEKRLEEERRRGREMRERLGRIKVASPATDPENVSSSPGAGAARVAGRERVGSWRPLSLVAKRSGAQGAHVRSASHQIPSSALAGPSVRSVSDTPHSTGTGSAMAHGRGRTPSLSRGLHVVVERDRPESPVPPPSDDMTHAGDVSLSSEPKSTYSWATSFSGETAELRTTATYLPRSADESRASISVDIGDMGKGEEAEETLDTPEKVKRRRKRIVAIAHTVRQLEGVGSREAEDPNFYGVLVKAWNDRPGFAPITAPPLYPPPSNSGLTDAPPALLPPPNLPGGYGAYSHLASPPSFTSPGMDSMFGSPPDPSIHTPALGFGGTSFTPIPVYEDYDEDASETSTQFRPSVRYSYASALHDLALEEPEQEAVSRAPTERAWMKGTSATAGRWSGAWEGWARPPPPPTSAAPPAAPAADPYLGGGEQDGEQTVDWTLQQTPQRIRQSSAHRLPESDTSHSVNLYPPPLEPLPPTPPDEISGTHTSDKGWGLGFMSAWWADRPNSGRDLAAQEQKPDFQMGEGEARWGGQHQHELSTPGHSTHRERDHHHTQITPGQSAHQVQVHRTPTTGGDTTSDLGSGISTPSFGMTIHASAERRWARPTIIQAPQHPSEEAVRAIEEGESTLTSPSKSPRAAQRQSQNQTRPSMDRPRWLGSTPMETSSSGMSIGSTLHPGMVTADSTSSNLTTSSTNAGEREFPFSSHCRPPSSGIPSSSDSTISTPSEIYHLRQAATRAGGVGQPERGENNLYWGGLANGSFPSDRTLRGTAQRQDQNQEREREEVLRSQTQIQGMGKKPEGLLARRHVRPLMLGELLNPEQKHDLNGTEGQIGQTAQPLSISLPTTLMINPQLFPPGSTLHSPLPSPSPASSTSQMLFLPPPSTPIGTITPTSVTRPGSRLPETQRVEEERMRQHQQPSFDPSSCRCGLNEQSGDTLPAQSDRQAQLCQCIRPDSAGMAAVSSQDEKGVDGEASEALAGQVGGKPSINLDSSSGPTTAELEVSHGGYRDATPSIILATLPPRRKGISPAWCFFLGFLMPWCWIFGGWSGQSRISEVSANTSEEDLEKGAKTAEKGRKGRGRGRWYQHPNPWVGRCRVAAGVVLPTVAVAGVVVVIVLAVLRGR